MRSRRGDEKGLSWRSLSLADKLMDRVEVAALLVVGKRENESVCSDTVIAQDCSPRNQNEEACRMFVY